MTIFFQYFLVHWAFMIVAYKYEIRKVIVRIAEKLNLKVLFNLSECQFCIEHHIGILAVGLFGLVHGYSCTMFLYPLMSAAVMNIIKFYKNGN